MTAITILGGDFEVLMDDETVGGNAVAGMRMVRRTAGASATVYTTNALYSAVADVMDDFVAMGFKNSMLPVTPNAYTMENKYFIPRSSTEWLKEGAITADWTVASGDGVYRKVYGSVTAAPVAGDIGRQVTEATSGDTGTLLDFETEPDGTTVLWIRPDTSGDTFALSTALTTTGDGGTLNVTGSGAATSGSTQYAAIQAIGSVPTASEVYLYQDRFKMTDSTGGFQWWTTDPTKSLGIISVLIRTLNAGVTIADGDVEVFARRYTSLYDNFRLNVSTGGFSALPLASAPDINNTTGYWDGAWDAGTGTAMQVGDVLSNTFSGKTGGKYVVTDVTDSGATGTFTWYEVGDLTPFADNDTFTSANRNGTIQGTPTAAVGGPTETGAGNGATVTITLGQTDVDHTGDGVTEPYSIEIDAQGDVPIATVYEVIKYRTRRGASATDLFGAGTNVPGESYRGLDGLFEYDANTGTMTEGDDINNAASAGSPTWTARLAGYNSTNSPTYITVMDQQTSLDSVVDDNVIDDETGDDVTVHAGGTLGLQLFTSPKSSPFGTFTGTQIFGARGVAFINPASADTQAYILTDDLGTLNSPPNTVSIDVGNTISGDRVLVARDTGTSGVIDKDQFGGLATPGADYNGFSDGKIQVAGSIDAEVPTSGYVRIVNLGLQEEHHYVYDSRTTGASGQFILRAVNNQTGVTASGTNETTLVVTGATFTTAPVVLPGMLVMNTDATNGGQDVYEVVSVDNATTLTIVKLYGSGSWTVGDDYQINLLIGDHDALTPTDYGTDDNVFDLILDVEATGTTTSNTLVKTPAANFGAVVNVRNGKNILPFTQNATVGDSGASITVVRTPDTIAT